MDTIFAEATPPGKGGLSVIRLSGPDSRKIASSLVDRIPGPRMAALCRIADGEEEIDSGLVLYFPAGSSFTGDEVVEFQLHGAPVIVDRLSEALRSRGARQAGPGEFTRRAFVNGRLDLTQVQGLSDLLAAETEAQRKLAMRNANGELGALAANWREDLILASALLMAAIDFPEEDTGPGPEDEAMDRVRKVQESLTSAITGSSAAEIVRRGVTVAIIGPPNAGKSTLLNRIAGRSVAIVSEIPGTTRDVIEVHLDLGGYAVTLLDTAGIRESADVIEAEGVQRARERAEDADLRIHISEDGSLDDMLFQPEDIILRSKADLAREGDDEHGIAVSGVTGEGIDELLDLLRGKLRGMVAGASLVAHQTQRDQIRVASAMLTSAIDQPSELAAEFVGLAIRELEALLGRVDIEQQLDVIFSRFCIGK